MLARSRLAKKRKIGVLLLLTLLSTCAYAVAPLLLPIPAPTHTVHKVLTLRDAVMLLIRNNPDLTSQYLQRAISKYNLEIAYNEFAPQYSLGGRAAYASGNQPLYQADPNVTLKTPIGAEIGMDVNNSMSGDGYQAVGTVSVTQPLLRGFGRTVVQNNLYTAQQQDYLDRLNLRGSVMQQIVALVGDYYQLVQDYNDLDVTKLSLNISKESLQQTQEKIAVGKAAPTDLVQYQQQVAQDHLTISQGENNIQRDYLQLLTILGLDPNSKLNIVKKITVDYSTVPNEQQAAALALANNVNYQAELINEQLAERAVLIAADQLKWQLDLKASAAKSFGNNLDNGFTPVGDTGNIAQKSLSLTLTIPLDDVENKANYEKAKIELQQEKIRLAEIKRQTITDVLNALRNLKAQRQQIKLAQDTVTWAQRSLDIERKKANYGRATPLDVTTVQNTLTSDRLQLITAQIGYINSLQQFYQTLGITLQKWGISIDY